MPRHLDNVQQNVDQPLDDSTTCDYLSRNDESILHRIFNPHLPFELSLELEQELNGVNGHATNGHTHEENTPTVLEAKELEKTGVEAANSGDHEKAVELFTSAINLAPGRPSTYNNRAQAYRLLRNVDGAASDLDKALELSEGRGPSACQAYTQRGIIRKLQDNQSEALEDFKKAASLGGQFAKSQVIAMNPYAALCGSAVAEMMQRARAENINQ